MSWNHDRRTPIQAYRARFARCIQQIKTVSSSVMLKTSGWTRQVHHGKAIIKNKEMPVPNSDSCPALDLVLGLLFVSKSENHQPIPNRPIPSNCDRGCCRKMQLWEYRMLSFFDQNDKERRKGRWISESNTSQADFLSSISSFLSSNHHVLLEKFLHRIWAVLLRKQSYSILLLWWIYCGHA